MSEERFVGLEMKKLEVSLTRFGTAFMKRTSDVDICPLQYEMIIRLGENGGSMVQKRLEECLGVRKSTLSEMLSTMIRYGYIEKTGSPDDLRSRIVSLTPKGEELRRGSEEGLRALDAALTTGVSPEDLEAFFRVADTMRRNIGDD